MNKQIDQDSKKKSNIKSNAMLNMIKQVCTVAFPLITFPYVSRILGTDNFGKVSFVNSIISYFSLIAGLGISTYAVREGARIKNNKEKMTAFVNEVYSINVCSSGLSLLLLLILVCFWNKLHAYSLLIFIYSFVIILTVIGSDWVNVIFEDFRYITLRYIVIQILCLVPIFCFVKKPNDYYIYTVILVLSGYGGNLLNLHYIRRYVKRRFTFRLNLKKHIKPILVLFSSMVAVRIYLSSDVTMIGVMCNDSETGIYGAVSKIYTIAKELINAITMVIIPRVSSLLNENRMEEYNVLAERVLKIILAFIMPMAVGLIVLSRDAIFIVNGVEYMDGNIALRLLSLALPFAVLSCFFSNAILIPNRKEEVYLTSTSLAAVVNIILNLFFINLWGMNGAAITTIIAEIIVFISVITNCRSLVDAKIGKRNIVSIVIGCTFVACVCIFIQETIANVILRVAISLVVSVLGYFVILILCKNDIINFGHQKRK